MNSFLNRELVYTARKFLPILQNEPAIIVIVFSDFVEIRGVRTPPSEDIPGCVRRCGEHLLGKERTPVVYNDEHCFPPALHAYRYIYAPVISRPREFPPFARRKKRDGETIMTRGTAACEKEPRGKATDLTTLNNVVNATTEIRNLLNFLRSARVSPSIYLCEVTEVSSYRTSLPKQSLPALSSLANHNRNAKAGRTVQLLLSTIHF